MEAWILSVLGRMTSGVPPDMVFSNLNNEHPEADAHLFYDVWYRLFAWGLVHPAPGREVAKAWVVTGLGRTAMVEGVAEALSAPDRYVEELRRSVPTISDITVDYAAEALRAYREGLLLASTVTIGAAAERSILDLVEGYTRFRNDPNTTRSFQQRRTIKEKFEYLKQRFESDPLRRTLPAALQAKGLTVAGLDHHYAEYETVVERIFDIYRMNRNDAGHPTGARMDREVLHLQLRAFRRFAQTVYALAKALDDAA